MSKRIFVASSPDNKLQPRVVDALLQDGHEVYDFRKPAGNEEFHWSHIDPKFETWTTEEFREAARHRLAMRAYYWNMKAIDMADACVLVLPCDLNAHMQFAYLIGRGRTGYVLAEEPPIPALMYVMARRICVSVDELVNEFRLPKFMVAS